MVDVQCFLPLVIPIHPNNAFNRLHCLCDARNLGNQDVSDEKAILLIDVDPFGGFIS